jgi:hypothetical protein
VDVFGAKRDLLKEVLANFLVSGITVVNNYNRKRRRIAE